MEMEVSMTMAMPVLGAPSLPSFLAPPPSPSALGLPALPGLMEATLRNLTPSKGSWVSSMGMR